MLPKLDTGIPGFLTGINQTERTGNKHILGQITTLPDRENPC